MMLFAYLSASFWRHFAACLSFRVTTAIFLVSLDFYVLLPVKVFHFLSSFDVITLLCTLRPEIS